MKPLASESVTGARAEQGSAGPAQVIGPYGDTLGDGRVQLSFTLPTDSSDTAREAARRLAVAMGLEEPAVVHAESMGQGFAFFVVYGRCRHQVDLSTIQVAEPAFDVLSKEAIGHLIEQHLGRPMVVIGACIETDAHTVGIDAIMNMKGFNGHKGLESYPGIRAINLGAQVDAQDLIARAIDEQADVILVSQVVTQKNIHLDNLTRLADLLEAEGLRERVILVVGGPRIGHEMAQELGYDAGFGPGTYAEHVASFAVTEWIRRHRPATPLATGTAPEPAT